MEPRIQYAKTSDGVNIAYWAIGSGPPLVMMPAPPFSHIQAEWEDAEMRRWFERISGSLTVVRYDGRGTGLSDPEPLDFSLEAQLIDLEGVLAAQSMGSAALLAQFFAGPAAITFVARHPERITHLVLWHSFADPADYVRTPQSEALLSLLEYDWELFAQTFAYARRGWSSGEAAQRFADFIRRSATPEALKAAMAKMTSDEYRVTDVLSEVTTPTLVLQRRDYLPAGAAGDQITMIGISRRLAAGIPGARLALLEGADGAPYAGDPEPVIRAVVEFMGVEHHGEPNRPRQMSSALTEREQEVLRLVASGESNKEIAVALKRSVHTVERHVANIYSKTGVRGRAEATAWALHNGLA
jgi:DNA-binding CsgD family transcriptional regulator/pimeloyl-ACP methyl ester carboxylesterase